ncbi:Aste57867_24504 [Aphanomyces stellatus]|uniref:Aste57867_24504 protein n=1 Tax=Aphanomyces stellatus TaxID=120398 RepID=A0A485LS65_9STRA|nr:hypothetical protein As57867_024427 [Aphanomyces stellatus]VFU01143.1 Aste57867_24504 [Aphanomyces stellatus]
MRYWYEKAELLQACSDNDDQRTRPRKATKNATNVMRRGPSGNDLEMAHKKSLVTSSVAKCISIEEIKNTFHLDMRDAAKHLRVQYSSLKKMCRSFGIERWPYHRVDSLTRTIASLTALANSNDDEDEKACLARKISDMEAKLLYVLNNPNDIGILDVPCENSPPNIQPMAMESIYILKATLDDNKTTSIATPKQNDDIIASTSVFRRGQQTISPLKVDTIKGENTEEMGVRGGRWLPEEHELFLNGLKEFGTNWKKLAMVIPSRSKVQIRTHAQKYFKKARLEM